MTAGDAAGTQGLCQLVGSAGPTAQAPGHATFAVRAEADAQTLLRSLVPSKPMVARIFNNKQFTRGDGTPLARTDALRPGDQCMLALVPTRASMRAATDPVDVLYQDAFVLAAQKPAGILVHGDGSDAPTLTARVQGYLARQGSTAVAQALHRLDVETSGVVLFSLTEEFQPAFDALFVGDAEHGHNLRKRYYAVVEGALPWHDAGWHVVQAPIARDRHDARRMRVGRTGKPAATRLRTLGTQSGRSLVEAELLTGRRHQIRVHLAHLGHPIVGDVLYGGARAQGLLLHACELVLTHPVSGQELTIQSPLPTRFGW